MIVIICVRESLLIRISFHLSRFLLSKLLFHPCSVGCNKAVVCDSLSDMRTINQSNSKRLIKQRKNNDSARLQPKESSFLRTRFSNFGQGPICTGCSFYVLCTSKSCQVTGSALIQKPFSGNNLSKLYITKILYSLL